MSEMFSRPAKDSHIATIRYETEMLRFAVNWLGQNSKTANETKDAVEVPGHDDVSEKNVYVYLECFLLHYRNLVEFFSGKASKTRHLRITEPEVWCGRKLTNQELESIRQPAGRLYTRYNGDISTYLAHCTKQRYEQDKLWNVSEMMKGIEPVIAEFGKVFPERTFETDHSLCVMAEGEVSTVGGGRSGRVQPL